MPCAENPSLFVCVCECLLCVIAIWSLDYKVVIKPL